MTPQRRLCCRARRLASSAAASLVATTAMAARSMGYRVHVLDPDPGCPARFVVDQCVEADWTDAAEAARLARGCDVIPLEIEQISLASMDAAASYVPVRPSESVLEVIQDRIEQKNWLLRSSFRWASIAPCARSTNCARR